MARQLRIQYEGAIYHLMSRGDRGEEIFRDDLDRRSFHGTLGATCQKTGWWVHAYCLMGNHFHLVVQTHRAKSAALDALAACFLRDDPMTSMTLLPLPESLRFQPRRILS